MRSVFTYLFFLTSVIFALGQGGTAAHVKLADRFYNNMAYAQAAEEYQAAADLGAVNEHVTGRLAECYLRLNEPQKAEYWYSTVVKFLNCSPENFYYYAEALKSNGRYEEAERLQELYWNRPTAQKEAFADSYADDVRRALEERGELPFDRLFDPREIERLGLNPDWFQE